MRILVLGAGAIGGYYGLHLAQAGADVQFLVRPGRAAQLAADGLVVSTRGETRRQSVRTLLAGRIDRSFDIVLLTCKAYDLHSAIEAVGPAVGPDSAVVPMLNGLAHLTVLDACFGAERVLGGVAYIASTLEEDGTIRHTSPTDIILFGERGGRETPPVRALVDAFAATPVAARASSEIEQDLWEKWCVLAAGAALTCLLRGTVGEVMATVDGPAVATTLIAETRAIAAAHGHAPRPPAIEDADRKLGDPGSRWAASMMRDIQQGAPRLETEQIVGDLIQRGRRLGIATPLLEAAHAHLQVYDARAARRAK